MSTRRGIHPLIASLATTDIQAGHLATTFPPVPGDVILREAGKLHHSVGYFSNDIYHPLVEKFKHIGLSMKIEDICPHGKSPSVSRLLELNILLVLKWHSFNTQALSDAILSPLLSLELVMPPFFEPSTIFLVSSSTSILSLFIECKCSSSLHNFSQMGM